MLGDGELVQRCLNGNQDAFALLVDRYKAYVFAVILHIVSEQTEAENIAQEVFLQVYRSLSQYRSANFKGWIGKIAAAKAIDWRRAHRQRAQETLMPEVASECAAGQSGWQLPEEVLLASENRQRVREICAKLPAVYRDVISRFYFEGKTYQQIAREDETTVKTVESRLYRARHLFRERWEEEG